MPDLVGGLRDRMVFDNFFNLVKDSLTSLGWATSLPQRKAVTFTSEPLNYLTKVEPNIVSVTDETVDEEEFELGSTSVISTWTFYVDILAENEAVAKHIRGDVKSFLGGRMPSIGRNFKALEVYDLSQPTKPLAFVCDILSIRGDRVHGPLGGPSNKNDPTSYYTVRVTLTDAEDGS